MATTGRPSISTPRTGDLRGIQQAIDNIRERQAAADKQITVLQSLVGANTTGQTIIALQTSLTSLTTALNVLKLRVDALEAASSAGQSGSIIFLTESVESEGSFYPPA